MTGDAERERDLYLTLRIASSTNRNRPKKGFTNVEITDAVVRAVPAGGMRCYLEGKSELTLESLRQILRAYYKERSATQLYSELCQLSQHTKESPTDSL